MAFESRSGQPQGRAINHELFTHKSRHNGRLKRLPASGQPLPVCTGELLNFFFFSLRTGGLNVESWGERVGKLPAKLVLNHLSVSL